MWHSSIGRFRPGEGLPRLKAKPNRSECARRVQSRLSEAFCGKPHSMDCNVPREHSPARSTLASIPEPGKTQGRVSETVLPPSCRCRHRAGCNEKEYEYRGLPLPRPANSNGAVTRGGGAGEKQIRLGPAFAGVKRVMHNLTVHLLSIEVTPGQDVLKRRRFGREFHAGQLIHLQCGCRLGIMAGAGAVRFSWHVG